MHKDADAVDFACHPDHTYCRDVEHHQRGDNLPRRYLERDACHHHNRRSERYDRAPERKRRVRVIEDRHSKNQCQDNRHRDGCLQLVGVLYRVHSRANSGKHSRVEEEATHKEQKQPHEHHHN